MNRIRNVVVALVLATSIAVTACQAGGSVVPQVGKQAIDFELPDLNGQAVSLSGLQGQPLVVNFWATWCGPCIHEMPFIQKVHDEWSARGLVVLAVNVGENMSRVQQFMTDNGLSFPVLLDTEGKVAGQYRVRGIPTTIFVDEEGIIRVMKVGAYPSKAAIETDLMKIIP